MIWDAGEHVVSVIRLGLAAAWLLFLSGAAVMAGRYWARGDRVRTWFYVGLSVVSFGAAASALTRALVFRSSPLSPAVGVTVTGLVISVAALCALIRKPLR